MDRHAAVPDADAGLGFVERKRIDWASMAELLSPSEHMNRWANFGPVSALLESHLHQSLKVHAEYEVVVTASATAALFALAGVNAARLGRPLRWVASAFGFFSTRIGPLADDTILVDCDSRALLDVAQLEGLRDDVWDGLIVTNVFGSNASLNAYKTFCREREKALLVDNAMCLWGFDRSSAPPPEIVSFHHTKPWGFGEGGCAILPRADAELFRHLIQFGHRTSSALGKFAANGKISELSSAAILQRLQGVHDWGHRYTVEWRRIARIADRVGFRVILEPVPGGIMGFIALHAPHPVAGERLARSVVPMMRYYPPLADRPVARSLFAHMVCVACHPGMASLDDLIIERELKQLLALPTS